MIFKGDLEGSPLDVRTALEALREIYPAISTGCFIRKPATMIT
jgi:hypothetical protein